MDFNGSQRISAGSNGLLLSNEELSQLSRSEKASAPELEPSIKKISQPGMSEKACLAELVQSKIDLFL